MKWPPLAVAIVAGTLAACSFARPTPAMRYYTLTIPGTPSARVDGPVKMGLFSVDPPYAGERLAYRSSPYLLEYYTYHRWAGNPRTLVAAAIRDYLEQGVMRTSNEPLDVNGHIRRLEEVDENGAFFGALAVDLSVSRGGRIVVERSFNEKEPAESRGPEAVVAALSRALGRAVDRLMHDIPSSVGASPAAAAPTPMRSR